MIEFGLPNATMHKRDEAVAVADLDVLARIYRRIAAGSAARDAAQRARQIATRRKRPRPLGRLQWRILVGFVARARRSGC